MGQNRRMACSCPKRACPSGIHNTHIYTRVPTSEVKGHCFRPSDVLLQRSPPLMEADLRLTARDKVGEMGL